MSFTKVYSTQVNLLQGVIVTDLSSMVKLSDQVRDLLDDSTESLGLSARAYHRVIKIARTIADLENSPNVEENHILEAIQYRPKVSA